jgi:hypothetical protein
MVVYIGIRTTSLSLYGSIVYMLTCYGRTIPDKQHLYLAKLGRHAWVGGVYAHTRLASRHQHRTH